MSSIEKIAEKIIRDNQHRVMVTTCINEIISEIGSELKKSKLSVTMAESKPYDDGYSFSVKFGNDSLDIKSGDFGYAEKQEDLKSEILEVITNSLFL